MFLVNNITDEHRLKIAKRIGVETIYQAMEYFRKNGITEDTKYQFYKENIAIWRLMGLDFIVNESFEERMAIENIKTISNITIKSKAGSFSIPCIKIELPKVSPFKGVKK